LAWTTTLSRCRADDASRFAPERSADDVMILLLPLHIDDDDDPTMELYCGWSTFSLLDTIVADDDDDVVDEEEDKDAALMTKLLDEPPLEKSKDASVLPLEALAADNRLLDRMDELLLVMVDTIAERAAGGTDTNVGGIDT
jgi:hypothetical protein